jgi:MtN3 and saliva related transmembrane protein
MIASLVGAAAATASVVSFAPQAWKVIRTRKTDELAMGSWVMNVVAFSLWTVFGIQRGLWAIIVPNIICLAFSIFILVMKLLPRRTRHHVADVLDPSIDSASPDASRRSTRP